MGQIAEETEERTPEGITAPVESHIPAPGVAEESHAPQQGLTVYDGMLFAMVTVWAINPAAIKWALDYLDPLVFNSLRFALATLVPLGLVFLSGEGLKWHKGDGWKLLALGLMGHGLYQTLFIVGLDATLAGNTALILSINPAFVATFGALLGYERVRGYSWAGVAMTLAGVGLVILGSGQELVLGERLMGDMLIVIVTII